MDGDAIRAQLPRPLSFSKPDRDQHGRRLGSLAQDLNRKGIISIVAAITPYHETREHNRGKIRNYLEIYCCCPVAVAESRDSRGLYAKARSGKISHFTGISDPYEEPRDPEVVVYTDREDIDPCLTRILIYLEKQGLIHLSPQPAPLQEARPGDYNPAS